MRPVSRDEFYAAVGPRDVHPETTTAFPYTSDWRLHRVGGRPLIGRTIDRVEGGRIVTQYFLAA